MYVNLHLAICGLAIFFLNPLSAVYSFDVDIRPSSESQSPEGAVDNSVPLTAEGSKEKIVLESQDFEASSDADDSSSKESTSDGSYYSDFKKFQQSGVEIDTEKSYTVSAMLPVGELLVLATPSGCALLDSPEADSSAKVEPLEFTFKVSELEDCGKLTDSILSELKSEISSNWELLSQSGSCKVGESFTTLKEIGLRTSPNGRDSYEYTETTTTPGDADQFATSFLASHLNVNLLPTTDDGVFVCHFDISESDSTQDDSKFEDFLNSLNDTISSNEFKELENKFKSVLEETKTRLDQEIDTGKKILDELSQHGIDSTECHKLSLDRCKSVSKCDVVSINGEETCFVSPRTIFWLADTNCGLQSRTALFSIARDLVSAGIMNEKHYQTMRQSYNASQICNAITHSYLSADITPKEDNIFNRAFEL
ncbi:signal peptide containing protein [Theileria equi strain WA]|uniref:Signal peptide containing protein n=1 Tax=Theileria equi strain WA TaxID=1537102 RepID=L1LGG7_THEEQ|nr:signal peptide containing protein [Theileria equi strain WA]EKX74340.1 signal peptide containing protein [Theileria equi strain WA]|eukprot:XP_004833792.1 signal peptide containing protein [Theileria equi strain WA]